MSDSFKDSVEIPAFYIAVFYFKLSVGYAHNPNQEKREIFCKFFPYAKLREKLIVGVQYV
jgi:hypothetical protein